MVVSSNVNIIVKVVMAVILHHLNKQIFLPRIVNLEGVDYPRLLQDYPEAIVLQDNLFYAKIADFDYMRWPPFRYQLVALS